jgi:large subunit ribosomal protein L25
MAELEIECLVTDIPSIIVHNVTEMKLDDVLHIKDLKLPPGVRALQDEDQVVAQLKAVEEEAGTPAAAEEGAAEPEVIGKKAEDGDAAAAAGEEK